MTVIITVEGGVVQSVDADGEVNAIIVDYDTDGIPAEEVDHLYESECAIHCTPVAVNRELVNDVRKALFQ